MSEDFEHKNVGKVALIIGAVVLVLGMLGVLINIG